MRRSRGGWAAALLRRGCGPLLNASKHLHISRSPSDRLMCRRLRRSSSAREGLRPCTTYALWLAQNHASWSSPVNVDPEWYGLGCGGTTKRAPTTTACTLRRRGSVTTATYARLQISVAIAAKSRLMTARPGGHAPRLPWHVRVIVRTCEHRGDSAVSNGPKVRQPAPEQRCIAVAWAEAPKDSALSWPWARRRVLWGSRTWINKVSEATIGCEENAIFRIQTGSAHVRHGVSVIF